MCGHPAAEGGASGKADAMRTPPGLRVPSLDGFDVVDHPGATVLCRQEAAAWVRYVLESGQRIYEAAAEERGALALEGRSTLFVIPAKGGGSAHEAPGTGKTGRRWAVRHYVRGGRLVPLVLGDRYLKGRKIRPFQETLASAAARRRGVPTPRVVAAAVYPAGLFYRGDLVTEFVEDSSDLIGTLFDAERKGAGGALERQDALQAAGALIRRMAEAGILHRDLHAGNILLQWEGSAPRPYLLDLDRCEVLSPGRRAGSGRMLSRLRRSLRKWEGWSGLRLSAKEWETLERAARP